MRVDGEAPGSQPSPEPPIGDPRKGQIMKRTLLFLPLFFLGACTTQVISSGGMAAVAPALSVERFLHATNTRDLHEMARLFGTEKGPIIETGGTLGCGFKKLGSWFGLGQRCRTLQEVELWMDAIAGILRHDDYEVVSESSVPGRVHPTTRVGVDIVVRGDTIRDVPFVVVRSGGGRWLVEEVGLDRITGRE